MKNRLEAALPYLAVRAGKNDLTMIIDAKSGEALKMSRLRPWS